MPDRPLRVIHVGQSMVRAGIEQWLKGLIRFLDPRRVQVVRCIATAAVYIDPGVVAEIGVPVDVGQGDAVREAARECDVLLCWGPRDLGAWIADCRPGLCVFVAHGEGPFTKYLLDGCAPVVDHVVAVSRRVRERNCRDLPSTVIPNGIDTAHLARSCSRAEMRRALGFGPDDFVLGTIGRFSPEKRPHVVIDAVAKLPDRFKALLVGWGEMYHELLDRANRLIPGRFAFATSVGAMGDYYQAIDALCMASAEEGFGLVALEAMMCERPVIATEVGCIPEFIRDRISGIIVEGTASSVRDAAEMLHRFPSWARGMAAEAKTLAEEHGHARVMARRYEDLLVRLWSQKRPATVA
jgi:glycosyltransferase involved in cell wall biosynthesis